MSAVSIEYLAYLFYSGVPWAKLTKKEQRAFIRYQKRKCRQEKKT